LVRMPKYQLLWKKFIISIPMIMMKQTHSIHLILQHYHYSLIIPIPIPYILITGWEHYTVMAHIPE
jgi:hypothetical protein